MTNLDEGQNEAVERALSVVRKGGAFKLLGKAGTGKTTTGKAIVESIIETGRKVICCAFTNKAVNRMKEVGYPADRCRTVHRLLYSTGIVIEIGDWTFTEDEADKILRNVDIGKILDKVGVKGGYPEETQEIQHKLVQMIKKGRGNRVSGSVLKTPEQLAKEGITRKTVIVVDELSMLPIDMSDELHGTFESVVYIGDPGQLPPVNSVDTCQYLSADDTVELKTVHRVSGNDYLLDLIYQLDAGKIPSGTAAIRVDKFQYMAERGFQFICYTNNGVAWMNEEVRRHLGLEGPPRAGEPLITVTRTRAKRNVQITDENRKWFLISQTRLEGQYTATRGQYGAVFKYERPFKQGEIVSVDIYRTLQKNIILKAADEPYEDDGSQLWTMPVTVDGDPEERIWLAKTMPFWKLEQQKKRAFRKVGKSMTVDFSYAITAHKAQGSEWPKVAVMLRQQYRNTDDQSEIRRWNYTAATRGKEDIQLFTSIVGCPYG